MPERSLCLSDETIASLAEGLLAPTEQAQAEAHAQGCPRCRELLMLATTVAREQAAHGVEAAPAALTERAKALVQPEAGPRIMDVVARFSEKALEKIDTTARILCAPWMPMPGFVRGTSTPAPDVAILEQPFGPYTCRVEISRPTAAACTVAVTLTQATTGSPISPVRITLSQGDHPRESHVTDRGRVAFEDIPFGSYRLTIRDAGHGPVHLNVQLAHA